MHVPKAYVFKMDLILPMFLSRAFNLTFAPGETSHTFVVEVINDLIPEVNEAFSVRLMEPVGGVRLGDQSVATVTILTNDDAHGLIGFAAVSEAYAVIGVLLYLVFTISILILLPAPISHFPFSIPVFSISNSPGTGHQHSCCTGSGEERWDLRAGPGQLGGDWGTQRGRGHTHLRGGQ